MSKNVSKAERTRQFIVEKTAPVFNAKGYAGTSLTDLTLATGLTKGSIYGNFENKDEVALATFDYNHNRVVNLIKERILLQENSIDRLLVYPTVYRDILSLPFLQAGCPILNTATEADDTHPQLREKAVNAITFWKTAVETEINRGKKRCEIKENTNASEFAVILIALVEGAIMQAKVTGNPTTLNTAMNYLAKLIEGLKP